MSHATWLHKFALGMVLFSLTLVQFTSAYAQSADSTPAIEEEVSANPGDRGGSADVVEKGEFTPGESSAIDTGKPHLYLPLVSADSTNEVNAAAPAVSWQTVFLDEFCSFPTGWVRDDYNGTGQTWAFLNVGGYCTAKPSGYTLKMNTYMQRTFSLAGAIDARMTFSFKMNTESGYDFLRYEYSCNGGNSWQSRSVQAESGAVSTWTVRTVSLASCVNMSSVQVRFTFQTDKSMVGSEAPTVDYVKVEKLF